MDGFLQFQILECTCVASSSLHGDIFKASKLTNHIFRYQVGKYRGKDINGIKHLTGKNEEEKEYRY